MSDAPLLELRGVSKRFAAASDLSTRIADRLRGRRASRVVHAVENVDLSIARGEVVGLVGESGSGKSTLGRIAAGLIEPSVGTPHVAAGHRRRDARPARGADDLPGPVRVAEPADARRRPRRGGAGRPRAVAARRARRADHRPARAGRARCVGARPLSASVLGRPARARRHRARTRRRPGAAGLRRGGRGARRVDAGAGAEPVHGPARRGRSGARARVSLHQPRPRRRAPPVRPRRDPVPRSPRRDRADRDAVRGAEPSVHAGAARRHADARGRPARVRSGRGVRRGVRRIGAAVAARDRRPAARSIRAARTRRTCRATAAAPRCRRCGRSTTGIARPAT